MCKLTELLEYIADIFDEFKIEIIFEGSIIYSSKGNYAFHVTKLSDWHKNRTVLGYKVNAAEAKILVRV